MISNSFLRYSISTLFMLGCVSLGTVVNAGGSGGLTDAAAAPVAAPAPLTPVNPAPFAQYNFGSKSVSLYFGTDTNFPDTFPNLPHVIGGFNVDAAPTAKFSWILADAQLPAPQNQVFFNGALKGFATGADGLFWDTFNADVSADVSGGDVAASVNILTGSDCLTTIGLAFEEGSGQPAGYVAAGTALRGQASGNINILGIPANHEVVAAWLYWSVMDYTFPSFQIDIDGNTVAAGLGGSDISPCWPESAIFGFAADVTPYVPGNGAYTISNLPAPVNPPGRMEGASLAVVHRIDPFDVEKSWTFTDYNWDPICTLIDIETGECLATRPANINFPGDDVLADPLAQDGDDNYIVLANANKEKVQNTNPGAFYALTTVDIKADVSSLTVTEEYEDCYADQGLIQFVSNRPTRNVKVAVADPAGDVTELTDDIYDGIGGAITFIDDTAAVVELTDASYLTEGSTVYVLVKFQDDLKNADAPGNFFDEMCVNAEFVETEVAPDFLVGDAAEAALRITTSP